MLIQLQTQLVGYHFALIWHNNHFHQVLSQLIIRPANAQDMPFVLDLIKELALYENAPEQVKNTVEQLTEDGFGTIPAFACFVAEEQNKIVGFALYYISYSTWRGKCIYLEDLCVTESHRKKGVGTKLFDEVLKIAKEQNMKRLSWQVLEWNIPAIEFYKKYKANLDPEWINGKLVLD